jgi:K+-transporting ATPase KdpF subunit
MQPSVRGYDAMVDLALSGILAAVLFGYLLFALLAPERF